MKTDRRTLLKLFGSGAAAGIAVGRWWPALADAMQKSVAAIAADPLRPECHLMPPHNWMNDPNGPIWWKGEYHLFYQLNPAGANWGNMNWGHAVSADMIHWKHEPIAMSPTPGGPDGAGCFSGSAVVFDGKPTFIYTGVQHVAEADATIHDGSSTPLRETQMLATAEDDRLLHWKKLEKPVIAAPPQGMVVTGFRDPCPWREGDTWYLGLGSGERGVGGCVLLYRSKDLRNWEYLHKLAQGKPNGKVATNPCDSGEMWECPDFFEVNGRHVLLYSTEGKVFWSTGEYDPREHRFMPTKTGVIDQGAVYAPKSFVAPDGRRVLWGWIRETRPEAQFVAAGWAGVMSLPRVLTVNRDGHLEMQPAVETEKLRGRAHSAKVGASAPLRLKLETLSGEYRVPIAASAQKIVLRLMTQGEKSWELAVDVEKKLVTCGDVSFALPRTPWTDDSVHVFLDGSVIESFIAGGEVLTSRVYTVVPNLTELEIELLKGPDIEVRYWPLEAISRDRLTT